ncbi:arylsulfatase [Maribellus sp. YY47]|uniref:sulfatase family protein n=1 Tax=Maribellus sp. YY47 TaxID=2929486 RepID=UPI00200134EE|nr:arylsulfatase [Maribellus sp. YY47]MCK3683343.1 arylsulfatase [Maribellus sp. YY47]
MYLIKPIYLFAGLLLLMSCSTSKKQEKKNPNIIFILADDLGYGDVSCFNPNSKIHTPNIDDLATDGVMFTDAHTSSAVCTPTRYSVLTGRYNWRSTLKSGVLSGYSKALIDRERLTLPAFLKENGYHTACFGKWHLGWDWKIIENDSLSKDDLNALPNVDYASPVENGPKTRGFDESYVFCGSLDMAPYVWVENDVPTMVPTKYTVNTGKQTWWRNGPTSDDFQHENVLPKVAEKTVEYIRKHAKDQHPFFVYMPLPAPHTPILPTEKFKGKSGLDNAYGDFVMMVDDVVGQVMKALDKAGVAENTLLIFTSDNGCSPQADFEQLATKGHHPSYVFRGAKADIYEGGHRVPFVVRWPANVASGVSKQLVCTTDLFATFAEVIGVAYPDNAAEDSYSFSAALGLESQAPERTSMVHHSINGSFAFRKGKYKAIFCPGSGGWSTPRPGSQEVKNLPPVQLYDLETDISEQKNLESEFPEIIEEYRSELTAIVKNGRSTVGVLQKNDGPETWPQLKWMKESAELTE